jgi:uncharacterized protein (TIGR00297 family)
VLVGTVIFGFGGWAWGAVLITFFVLSSLLSSFRAAAKQELAVTFAKGGQRDLGQVLANGGAGALTALVYPFAPLPAVVAAFVGAMASVNADTWATELGVLSRRRPRLLTTWREVEPGTSGAVSMQGTIATLAGALTIGLATLLYLGLEGLAGGQGISALGPDCSWLLPAAALGGLAGSLFDSLLGATVQAMYYSPGRQKETERRIDPDGASNRFLRGWPWMGNDQVNFLASILGAAVSVLVMMAMTRG